MLDYAARSAVSSFNTLCAPSSSTLILSFFFSTGGSSSDSFSSDFSSIYTVSSRDDTTIGSPHKMKFPSAICCSSPISSSDSSSCSRSLSSLRLRGSRAVLVIDVNEIESLIFLDMTVTVSVTLESEGLWDSWIQIVASFAYGCLLWGSDSV